MWRRKATSRSGNVEERRFSLEKGWPQPQENIAKQPYWERTAWFVQTTDNRWLERTTRSARANVASRNFLIAHPLLPYPRNYADRTDGREPIQNLNFKANCTSLERVAS
jgi:hypothetical protein